MSLLQARAIVSVQPKLGTSTVDEKWWRIGEVEVIAWRIARAAHGKFARDVNLLLRLVERSAASLTGFSLGVEIS